MPNGVQIFQAQSTTGFSLPFYISRPTDYRSPNNLPMMGIYGTLGTPTFQLQWQAPDGSWYDANETCFLTPAIGLYQLPVSAEVQLRLSYTAGGGSVISAFVYDGQYKPND